MKAVQEMELMYFNAQAFPLSKIFEFPKILGRLSDLRNM